MAKLSAVEFILMIVTITVMVATITMAYLLGILTEKPYDEWEDDDCPSCPSCPTCSTGPVTYTTRKKVEIIGNSCDCLVCDNLPDKVDDNIVDDSTVASTSKTLRRSERKVHLDTKIYNFKRNQVPIEEYSMAVALLTKDDDYVCSGVVVARNKVLTGECLLAAPNKKWTDFKVRTLSNRWDKLDSKGRDYDIAGATVASGGLYLVQTHNDITNVMTAKFYNDTDWSRAIAMGWTRTAVVERGRVLTGYDLDEKEMSCSDPECVPSAECDFAEIGHFLLEKSSKRLLGISTGRGCSQKILSGKTKQFIHWTALYNTPHWRWLQKQGVIGG